MRMKKSIKYVALIIAVCILFLSITACLNSSKENEHSPSDKLTSNKTAKFTELKVYLAGDDNKHYRNVSQVINEFEKRTKNTLNIKLDITWTTPTEYRQKLPMWIAAGEQMDIVIDAPWTNLNKLAKDGAYMDLGKYFNNSQYPGLMKAFPLDYINSNKLLGKVYAIPITNAFMDMEGVVYRKDLLKKYGMKPISSYDDLYAFLTKVDENEKDMIPYGPYGKAGFFKLFNEPSERQLNGRVFSFLNFIDVAISADGNSVAGIAAYGDSDEDYKNFDSRFGKQYILNYYNNCKKYNRFLPKNVLANEGNTGKEYGAFYSTISGFINSENQVKAKNPRAELDFWPIYKNNQEMIPGSQATDYKAWNYVCIPATTKKADKAMQFMDWIFASQENNDLFTFGIEGVNWSLDKDNQLSLINNADPGRNYLFPGYQLTWNPIYYRVPAGLPENLQNYIQYEFKSDTYRETMLAGFTFDQNPVKTEIAKCNYITDKYLFPLACGLFDYPEGKLKELNKELYVAGVDRIKAELKKQINEFLLENK